MKIKAYNGHPFTYSTRKSRYWDTRKEYKTSTSSNLDITLQPYSGIKYHSEISSESIPVLNIAAQQLPNLDILNEAKNICIAPQGNYICSIQSTDLKQIGNMNNENGTYSNFSDHNTLKINKEIPNYTHFKCIGKFKIGNFNFTNMIIYFDNEKMNNLVANASYKINFAGYNGTTSLKTNKKYWFCLETGTFGIKTYLLEDNNYTLETLPELSNGWSLEIDKSTIIQKPIYFYLGNPDVINRNNYNSSTLYLNDFKIWLDDTLWWHLNSTHTNNAVKKGILHPEETEDISEKNYNIFAKKKSNALLEYDLTLSSKDELQNWMWIGKYKVPKLPQFQFSPIALTAKGEIQIENKIAYEFSSQDYLSGPLEIPGLPFFAPDKIEFLTHFQYFSYQSQSQTAFAVNGTDLFNVDSTHIIKTQLSGNYKLIPKYYYWFKLIELKSGTYSAYILKDTSSYTQQNLPEISSWTRICTITGSIFANGEISIGINSATEPINSFWQGKIDLGNTKITVNDDVVWSPQI